MKNTLLSLFLFSILLLACNSKRKGETKPGLVSNLVSITDNEDRGIKEIISFYGGKCEYGFTKKTSGETDFWLKFSKSPSIDSLAEFAELSCSNIAYLFYKNLQEEKNNYKNIESELTLGDGTVFKQSYKIAELEIVKTKMELIYKIVDLIKLKKYKEIGSYMAADTSLFMFDKDKLIGNISQIEVKLGNPKQFVPYGFSFLSAKGKLILHISGAIQRENSKSSYFSVNLDPNSPSEEIYILNYKL